MSLFFSALKMRALPNERKKKKGKIVALIVRPCRVYAHRTGSSGCPILELPCLCTHLRSCRCSCFSARTCFPAGAARGAVLRLCAFSCSRRLAGCFLRIAWTATRSPFVRAELGGLRWLTRPTASLARSNAADALFTMRTPFKHSRAVMKKSAEEKAQAAAHLMTKKFSAGCF